MGPLPDSASAPNIGWTEPVKPSKPVNTRHPGDPPTKPVKAVSKAPYGKGGLGPASPKACSPRSPRSNGNGIMGKNSPRLGRSQTEVNLLNSRGSNGRSDLQQKVMAKALYNGYKSPYPACRPSLPVSMIPDKPLKQKVPPKQGSPSPREWRSPSPRQWTSPTPRDDMYVTCYSLSFPCHIKRDRSLSLTPRRELEISCRNIPKPNSECMTGYRRTVNGGFLKDAKPMDAGYTTENCGGLSVANIGCGAGWITGPGGDSKVNCNSFLNSPARRELELSARRIAKPDIDRVKGFGRTNNGGYWQDREHASCTAASMVPRPLQGVSPRSEALPLSPRREAQPAAPGPGFGRTTYGGYYPRRFYEQYLD